MRSKVFKMAATNGLMVLDACENHAPEQRTAEGVPAGTATGLVKADVLKADKDWRSIATLVGTVMRTVVAANSKTQNCAYPQGYGNYQTAPCT
jgi:osmotically inducible lipoprotein OsmB